MKDFGVFIIPLKTHESQLEVTRSQDWIFVEQNNIFIPESSTFQLNSFDTGFFDLNLSIQTSNQNPSPNCQEQQPLKMKKEDNPNSKEKLNEIDESMKKRSIYESNELMSPTYDTFLRSSKEEELDEFISQALL